VNLELTRCAMLTSKQEQYAELPPVNFDPDHISPPKHYWCQKTMSALGPDYDEAYLEVCQPGRECYCSVITLRETG